MQMEGYNLILFLSSCCIICISTYLLETPVASLLCFPDFLIAFLYYTVKTLFEDGQSTFGFRGT